MSLNKPVLSILSLEDSKEDFELLSEFLNQSDIEFTIRRVDNESEFKKTIQTEKYDVILADFNLPGYDAFSALEAANQLCTNVPFIVVSGSLGEETAIEFIKKGAVDYILKDKPERLPFAIKRAINEIKDKELRLQTEIALKKSQEQYWNLFNSSLDAILMISEKGRVMSANPSACEIFGYQKDEINNAQLGDLLDGADPGLSAAFDELSANGKFLSELTLIRKDHSKFPAEISAATFINKDHRIITNMIIRDITSRKINEEQLLKAKQKAEESDNLKTAFLHNISHEIRTPLNAIVGFSTLIAEETPAENRFHHYNDVIVKSSDQLLSIISDIINIATIEAGQAVINDEPVNITEQLELLYNQHKPGANEKGIDIRFETDLTENCGAIITDPVKLSEILNNLIGNAVKFTLKGSVLFGVKNNQKELTFYVKDTGIGIAPELHEIIFKRFRQVDYKATRFFGGSGLGLSISKAYVELLGGRIWLESDLGKGSVFYFTIPCNEGVPSEVDLSTGNNETPFIIEPCTILLADDEVYNHLLVQELLLKMNIKVIRAMDGSEAVEICKARTDLSLVLMDIKMPVMDGYEATGIIKQIRPDLTIIALTAYSTDADIEKAKSSGCDDFISKPFNHEQLLSTIKLYLRKKNSPKQQ
ncbi:MAG TPA: response regulator [Bacteroidales bacterium]|nr:response regulator [Bacteroidales bacterium]